MGKLASWHENDRIRREGTHNLVEAALAEGGVHVFIYPSFALVYPDSGDKWIDADIGTTSAMGGRALPGLVEKQSMPE
jgi:nucleoside-diphosphate-sugar epimerase